MEPPPCLNPCPISMTPKGIEIKNLSVDVLKKDWIFKVSPKITFTQSEDKCSNLHEEKITKTHKLSSSMHISDFAL